MGRFNENSAWKEFRRWLAAAFLGCYVTGTLYAVFLLAEPFATAVVQDTGWWALRGAVRWLFRIIALLNLVAVVWACMRIIERQEGDWPG